ncbi:MAG TPA: helix-turn-helix domain-containing protein [Candidatus Acidoferrum sp.]|nr:helix-turn-helix domain-containing protein [Candidatus Acidoferrum sp.]
MTDAALRTRLLACAQYALVAATQLAACNKVHSLEERYARWLLMAHDRVGNELTLTHETSAQILGVRRAGVTVVAGLMANAGIIRYRRGHLDQWHEINRVRMRSCLVVASRERAARIEELCRRAGRSPGVAPRSRSS